MQKKIGIIEGKSCNSETTIKQINDNEIVRLEMYEAYPNLSQLSKTYDLRSLELQNQKLKNSYYEDMM